MNRVDQLTLVISSIGLAGLMILISAGVITRYIFGFSIPTAYEITENFLMPMTVFAALGYSYRTGIFPRVDAFVNGLTNLRLKQIINVIILGLELIVFLFISYHLFQFFLYSIDTGMGFRSGRISFPLYHIHFLMFISFAWMTVRVIPKIINANKEKSEDPYEEY